MFRAIGRFVSKLTRRRLLPAAEGPRWTPQDEADLRLARKNRQSTRRLVARKSDALHADLARQTWGAATGWRGAR